ncbi:MAG: flotillin family protein [Candidatus Hydrogenedentes bacterium]|nr:flotillin family protein [Candidatus Hydrogenedentota bacterium]
MQGLIGIVALFVGVIAVAIMVMVIKCWRKVEQGTALIITGGSKPSVHFSKAIVLPLIRQHEVMDISVRRIEIFRHGAQGLVCQDNVRADIKVAFFVRVNNNEEDVLKVAQSIGAARASEESKLEELFDAKFSEALKTVGKKFDFIALYTSREEFKEEILNIIGRDLNGYVLDDAAIDYLEQTPMNQLDPNNILDSEGIKKITDLTAQQQILANSITRDKEKIIKKQDVEAREAILELERQQAEAEAKQLREIESVQAREQAEAAKIKEEERLKSERARITTEEEVAIANENKDRQVIVALRNKERTDQVEKERVEKDRMLEATERERVVALAAIEKDKAIEVEKKAIQDVIRERVIVERAVVEEQERIKDTQEFATAERAKKVAITAAEQNAQEALVKEIKAAEARRDAARFSAEEQVISAEALRDASEREAVGKKLLAEGVTAEQAAAGLAEAAVIESKAVAEARGLEARAAATKKQGEAEAEVMQLKFEADAKGITDKAEAMKLFNEVGREHEEFKLNLEKTKAIELAAIAAQEEIARQQAAILGEALKSARIDIVGGEAQFFDKITSAITNGKSVDRLVDNSRALTDVKNTFFNGDPAYFKARMEQFTQQFGIGSEDVKNLSVAALLNKMRGLAESEADEGEFDILAGLAKQFGFSKKKLSQIL